jgi:hypothetical protein
VDVDHFSSIFRMDMDQFPSSHITHDIQLGWKSHVNESALQSWLW